MIDAAADVDVECQSDGSVTAVLQVEERVGETLRRTEARRLVCVVFQRQALIARVDEAVDVDGQQLIVESVAVET